MVSWGSPSCCLGICRRRASSIDRLLMLTNALTAGWLGRMAISGQTQPQEFSLYRYRKGKSDPEHGKWSKRRDLGGQNKRTMQRRFVPPWPYRVGSGVNWFGNDGFWTQLPADVTWGRGEKTFWFRPWGYYGQRPWDTGKGCWQVDGCGTQARWSGTARCDLESHQFDRRRVTGRPS